MKPLEFNMGNRASLTADERDLLENQVLPTARRWLNNPRLREHGERTLAYWGEEIPRDQE